jgi:heme exporter protein C
MILILYALIAGMLIPVPLYPGIGESIRNLFYHVGMWFVMLTLLFVSLIYSIRYLNSRNPQHDQIAVNAVNVALLFGFAGLVTGMMWAWFAWGAVWVSDPKLNGAALGIIMYLAYRVLRSSIQERGKKAAVAAVFNIFAFTFYLIFVFILPRISGLSIHPGSDGNMMLAPQSLDPWLRLVFYPAVAGWILLGLWILNIKNRISKLSDNPSL